MSYGWRIPFILSSIGLAVGMYIRLYVQESPAFEKIKSKKAVLKSPIKAVWKNHRRHLFIAIGARFSENTAGYIFQVWALSYLTVQLKVDASIGLLAVLIGAGLGAVLNPFWGMLSDRIGRKPIIIGGCLIAALTYFPIFAGLTHYANPALEAALKNAPVIVTADPATCQFQFNPTGTKKFTSSCDIAKAKLSAASVNYENAVGAPGSVTTVKIGERIINSYDANGLSKEDAAAKDKAFSKELADDIKAAGYPTKAESGSDEQTDGLAAAVHPGAVCDHGVRSDCSGAGGNVPDPHPLHIDVHALPHR